MKWLDTFGKRLFVTLLVPVLTACAHFSDAGMYSHPLIGKVWDVSARRFVNPATVIDRAVEARYVLLGEIHDNAEHHRIQARVLDAMLERGRKPALVMEQYDVNQQDKVNDAARSKDDAGEKLRELRELMRTSWNWRYYEPLVSRALREKLPLIAANMPREALRTVAREGYGVLGTGEEERLALATVWNDARQKQLTREVTLGHCGKVPEHVIDSVTKSQRARDAVMADKLLVAKRNGAVAVFGRNHVRQDIGVPLYLAARAPNDATLSIGLMEVDTPTDPVAYTASPVGQLHDYIWFTPRPRRNVNPCDSIPAAPKATG